MRTTLLATALLAPTALTGYLVAPAPAAHAEPYACSYLWNPPYGLVVTAPKVSARILVFCDPAPKSHTTFLYLEKKNAKGDWEMVHEVNYDLPIPVSAAAGGTPFDIEYFCSPGEWKAMFTASGIGPNGKPFDYGPDSPEYRDDAIVKRTITDKDCPTG